MLVFPSLTLEQHTTFKESMIFGYQILLLVIARQPKYHRFYALLFIFCLSWLFNLCTIDFRPVSIYPTDCQDNLFQLFQFTLLITDCQDNAQAADEQSQNGGEELEGGEKKSIFECRFDNSSCTC